MRPFFKTVRTEARLERLAVDKATIAMKVGCRRLGLSAFQKTREFVHRIDGRNEWFDGDKPFVIQGFCVRDAADGAITSVAAVVNGTWYPGSYGVKREDLSFRLGRTDLPDQCGYEISLPLPKQNSEVRLMARLDSGQWRRFSSRLLRLRRIPAWQAALQQRLERTSFRRVSSAAAHGAHAKRRVLLVSHRLDNSGAPIMLLHLATALQARNYFVCVICPGRDGPLRPTFEKRGIPVFIIPALAKPCVTAVKELRCFDVAIISTVSMHRCLRNVRRAGLPTVWFLQAGETGRFTMLSNPSARAACLETTSVIFPSHHTASLHQDFHLPQAVVIPNGLPEIDGAGPRPRREEEGRNHTASRLIFLQLGVISRRKGQDILIDALLRLKPAQRDLAEFRILGESRDPSYYKQCLHRAETLTNLKWFPGTSHQEALDQLRAADVLLVPSRDEAFPNVIQEAMALGKPVIASDAGGITECVTDDVTGWLFPRGDSARLAELIGRALKERPRLQVLGEAGRKARAQHFGVGAMADRYERVIEYAIEKESNRSPHLVADPVG